MARLDSNDVRRALLGKMQATEDNRHDVYFHICDDDGQKVAFTRLSHGRKETLGDHRVSEMARQLRLDDAESLVQLVRCPLDRDAALQMMKRNPTDAARYRQKR